MNKKEIKKLLKSLPDKWDHNKTTSIKFKEDLIDFFIDDLNGKDMSLLELGTNHGHTTHILAPLFKRVVTVDWADVNLNASKELNKSYSNIEHIKLNVYKDVWPNFGEIDVVFVDCMHTYDAVMHDISKCLDITSSERDFYFIFDDYGLDWGPNKGQVKAAVDEFIRKGKIEIVKSIGHLKGKKVQDYDDALLGDVEGLICKVKRMEFNKQWWQ